MAAQQTSFLMFFIECFLLVNGSLETFKDPLRAKVQATAQSTACKADTRASIPAFRRDQFRLFLPLLSLWVDRQLAFVALREVVHAGLRLL